jgi:regulator of protease activity HflC (stomatin/prohibitin superfamily)
VISPERFAQAIARFLRIVVLPAMILLAMATAAEIARPAFELRGLLTLSGLGSFLGHAVLNALPGLAAILAIPVLAGWFLNSLYGLGGVRKGHLFLWYQMFGPVSARPWAVIKEGRVTGDVNQPLIRLGGPGLLVIYNDSAVVTEQNGRLKRILGPGYHRLEPYERVWEVVDLRPQHWVYPVSALTRDGIPISCDADVTFKIDDREGGIRKEPTGKQPYPFTEEAVLKAATATWIREEEREDQVMKWTGRVMISMAEGALRSILAQYRLDRLVAPDEPSGPHETREEIRERLRSALEESAPEVGAMILNVDIGRIDIKVDLAEEDEAAAEVLSDQVLQQWIQTWQAEMNRLDLVERAGGEAEMARLEAVSVQAQAEMVLTLTEAMQSLVRAEEASAYHRALRLIETLRWMTFDPDVRAFVPLETLRSLQKLEEIVEMDRLPADASRPSGEDDAGVGGDRSRRSRP